ncbi:MAG: ABC transporter permease subunit [Arachnia propionica]|uniref:ABC transporter permease n=1 Tax=Arachnia propionica TaxID=1750 RepID=UPI00270C3EA9|nr:ABC transporter permease subunit [Arachnia propionica]
MKQPGRTALRWRETLLWWLGLGMVVGIWALVARDQPAYALPSPAATWDALLALIRDEELIPSIWLTFQRAVLGLGFALLIGLPWGWAAGTWRPIAELTVSWLQLLMAIPPIVIVVVGMLWFGPRPEVVLLVVTLVTLPLLVTAVRDAVAGVDQDLLEMARLFGFGLLGTLHRVVVPAVVPPVLSAITVAVGQSIRLTVMAELLSTATGIGAEVQQARTNLETADVFALSGIMAALTLGLEVLLLQPARRRLSRHR